MWEGKLEWAPSSSIVGRVVGVSPRNFLCRKSSWSGLPAVPNMLEELSQLITMSSCVGKIARMGPDPFYAGRVFRVGDNHCCVEGKIKVGPQSFQCWHISSKRALTPPVLEE